MTYKMDVQFIQPFIDGAVETLKIQCRVSASAGAPFLKKKGQDAPVDIAGQIGIASEHFRGSISLCFPKKTFLGVMGKMLDEDYRMMTEELEDGAGELMNIIFGFAKRELNQKGYELPKAIPAVIRGHRLNQLKPAGPVIVLPFESEMGQFQIEIGVEQ